MIEIKNISISKLDKYWGFYTKYLIEDGILSNEDDILYFSGEEYKKEIKENIKNNQQTIAYFIRNRIIIGAVSYNISIKNNTCFIYDFWVFPEYRGNHTGSNCFFALKEYTLLEGVRTYSLSSSNESSIKFWESLGFQKNGMSKYGITLTMNIK